MSFADTWKRAVSHRGSVLCAGLDPAEWSLGRGEKGLARDADRREFSLRYVEAVAPYVSALKPNVQYWKAPGDAVVLEEVCAAARDLGLLVIEDAKLADIGATNDAGFYYAARRADAVTYAPFAGNIAEATSQAHARGIGIIVLSLMSNPEYEQEKQKRTGSSGQPQYLTIAEEAAAANADAVVVGAPSETNHIEDEEIRAVRDRIGSHMVVLMPGVGAQGGSASSVWRVFDTDQVIVNAGRSLMFPNGSESTPEQQARAALELRDRLNEERSVS